MIKAQGDQKEIRFDLGSLDPVSRASEILFGLIMVLTFTCSLSAAEAGQQEVKELLIGALGCNIAWGIIDAFFYIMSVAAARGREQVLASKLKAVTDRTIVQKLFENIIPESLIGSLSQRSFEEVREDYLKYHKNASTSLIRGEDIKAALLIFILVFLTTFPVSVPFMLMSDPIRALRVSNLIALILLFGVGYSLGEFAGRPKLRWGIGMAITGSLLVSMTMALGG